MQKLTAEIIIRPNAFTGMQDKALEIETKKIIYTCIRKSTKCLNYLRAYMVKFFILILSLINR